MSCQISRQADGGKSMFRMNVLKAAGVAAVIALLCAAGAAQTGQVEGTVKVKNADGTMKPVVGALIDIYRRDIKAHYDVKTDKNGHFIRLGMPLQGTYLFILSGPGIAPTYMNNVRITQMPVVDFTAEAGDGHTLSLDEVQKTLGQQKAGGGGAPAPGRAIPPGDKAKMEAAQKEQEAKLKEGKELQENFDQARTHYNTGVELMKASNYQNALSEFEQATAIDPSKHAAMLMLSYRANANLAEAHY